MSSARQWSRYGLLLVLGLLAALLTAFSTVPASATEPLATANATATDSGNYTYDTVGQPAQRVRNNSQLAGSIRRSSDGKQQRSGAASSTLSCQFVIAAETAGTVEGVGIVTTHGVGRVAGAAATRGGVLSADQIGAVRAGGQLLRQADGATVRVLPNASGRFDVVVDGEKGLITTFQNLSEKSLQRLANNYGWGAGG